MGRPMTLSEDSQQSRRHLVLPSSPQSRLSTIQRRLLDVILELRLQPGDPLPTEQDLLSEIGVARNSLREAIKTLQALGIVEIRHGSGTYLRASTFDPLIDMLEFRATLSMQSDRREARELLHLREALETGLLPIAVAQIRPDDLDRLSREVELMRAAPDRRVIKEHDSEFHEVLYASLGNRTLTALLAAFWRVNTDTFIKDSQNDLATTAAAHLRIYEAVAAGDADEAVVAMRAHFGPLRAQLEADPVGANETEGLSAAPDVS